MVVPNNGWHIGKWNLRFPTLTEALDIQTVDSGQFLSRIRSNNHSQSSCTTIDSLQLTVDSRQLTVDSGQLIVDSGQLTVDSEGLD